MIDNRSFEINALSLIRQRIDEIVTKEEKGLIHISKDEKKGAAQREQLVRQNLPTIISNSLQTKQLQCWIDNRRHLEVLNLAGREDISSMKDIWIPPSVKVINLENCVDINTLNENNISNYIIKLKDIINIPKLEIDKENIFKLLNGQIINLNLPDGLYSLNDSEDIVALIKVKNNSAKMSIFLD